MHHVSHLIALLSLLLSVHQASCKVVATFLKQEEQNHVPSLEDNNDVDFVKYWNSVNCHNNGCKNITTSLLQRMKRFTSAGDERTQRHAMLDALRKRNDVLDPLFHPTTSPAVQNQTTASLKVKYLGVMVDAGRHYFSIEWLHNLLNLMSVMNFNLLHLRLTGDSAFRVRLDSMPALANPVDSNEVYTPSELEELIEYANKLGIHIMPEINLPSHAGGWAGSIPGMIVPCPERICYEPVSLPLNLQNPNVTQIVQTVLREVVQIFDKSPFLHLGGNDVKLSTECLVETNYMSFAKDYQKFETNLIKFLRDDLQVKQQVVRWEYSPPSGMTLAHDEIQGMVDAVNPLSDAIGRVNRGDDNVISHYRISDDFRRREGASKKQIFCSDHNFDSRQDSSGFHVYKSTKAMIDAKQPLAVVADTRDLGMYEWFDRNVLGKLASVAMGATKSGASRTESFKWCRDRLGQDICALQGAPLLADPLYSVAASGMQILSDARICNRLTSGERQRVRKFKRNRKIQTELAEQTMSNFWNRLGQTPLFTASTIPPAEYSTHHEALKQHVGSGSVVERTGIVLDLVQIARTDMSRILSTLDLMNALGMNTLQLRIMSDHGFVTEINGHHGLLWGRVPDSYFSEQDLQHIVTRAESLGIQVIPELATATRGAAGWYAAGLLENCPNHVCQGGIAGLDTTNNNLFSTIISVLHELVDQFHHPPYIQLGYDERNEVQACFKEAFRVADLDEFERRLKKTLKFHRFDESRLIRWENPDGGAANLHRAGKVTHHYLTEPPESKDDGTESFASLNLTDTQVDAWDVYRQTRKLLSLRPTAILATVNWLDEAFWNEFAITQRLVALAMGIGSSDSMSKSAFDDKLKTALSHFDLEGGGRVTNDTFAKQMLVDGWTSHNERACRARTGLIGKFLPKEGVLV